jgi:Tfp pilus assembly protein PilF
VQREPQLAAAHVELAEMYAQDGLTEMAVEQYREAVRLAPSAGYQKRLAELTASQNSKRRDF